MITVIGYPSHVGGADTELWHTLKLWRRFNHDVQCIPTWGPPPKEWEERLESIGVKTIQCTAETLPKIDIAVSFCNAPFLSIAERLKESGSKLIWLNCMTFSFSGEKTFMEKHGAFDMHVFQSKFQRDQLIERLPTIPPENQEVIHGAFDFDSWCFAPRPRDSQYFIVGRAARPDRDKWSSNLWPIIKRINYEPLSAWLMGINDKVYEKLGAPPANATVFRPNEMPILQFYANLHAMLCVNGGAQENWPRIGLEAMSRGVPIVTQNSWGWKEMLVHNETGFLCNNDCELAHYVAVLAHDEQKRQEIAKSARARLEEEIANPARIAAQWADVFQRVAVS